MLTADVVFVPASGAVRRCTDFRSAAASCWPPPPVRLKLRAAPPLGGEKARRLGPDAERERKKKRGPTLFRARRAGASSCRLALSTLVAIASRHDSCSHSPPNVSPLFFHQSNHPGQLDVGPLGFWPRRSRTEARAHARCLASGEGKGRSGRGAGGVDSPTPRADTAAPTVRITVVVMFPFVS